MENKVADIANLEMQCRRELHEFQIENERKRARNLDLEYELLRAKILFYTQK